MFAIAVIQSIINIDDKEVSRRLRIILEAVGVISVPARRS